MSDHKNWLTEDDARPKSDAVVNAIRLDIENRRSHGWYSGSSEDIARALNEGHKASAAIQVSWFFASLGIIDPIDGNKETYFLSSAPGAYYFSLHNVVPWTNWLGDLFTRLRVAAENGEFPEKIEYGPPKYRKVSPVGPLVEYFFKNGAIAHLTFKTRDVAHPVNTPGHTLRKEATFAPSRLETAELVRERPEMSAQPRQCTEPTKPPFAPISRQPQVIGDKAHPEFSASEAPRTFGLKDIVRTVDLEQNDRIRGPLHGIFILMGGPGVGKTTVALHRIPFLINEQVPYDELGRRVPSIESELLYRQDNMLIVVWKVHLVPYLRRSLQQLGMSEFPDSNVAHIHDWIDRTIRSYVRIGRGAGAVRIVPESAVVQKLKMLLDENGLYDFLDSDFPLADELDAFIQTGVQAIHGKLRQMHLAFPSFVEFTFSVSGINSLFEQLVENLPRPNPRNAYNDRVDREIKEQLQQMRREALDRVTRFVEMLQQYYQSNTALTELTEACGEELVNEFSAAVEEQAGQAISRADMYLLLWLIHWIADDSNARSERHKPLPSYSHVMIDEAQYYHPVILRLFSELVSLPNASMTIVGDLEQRITTEGGLASWGEAGLEVPEVNIHRLTTNYRWSEQVFRFLKLYHDAAGITEPLRAPRQWYSGQGRPPRISQLSNREDEIDFVAESISDLRNEASTAKWTIAVVVPDELIDSGKSALVTQLKSYGVPARWADGEDVQESVDRVIVTSFDNVVGLEFDAVFIMGMDQGLEGDSTENKRRVWVALTRARQFIQVSKIDKDLIFDLREFVERYGIRENLAEIDETLDLDEETLDEWPPHEWSSDVLEFLTAFRDATGLQEESLPPPNINERGWQNVAEIVTLETRQAEVTYIAEKIAAVWRSSNADRGSIVVIVPEVLRATVKPALLSKLKALGIVARWEEGDRAEESTDQVLLTGLDDVHGRMFDSVYLLGADEATEGGSTQGIRRVWDSLKSARRFIGVSKCAADRVFDRLEFESFFHEVS